LTDGGLAYNPLDFDGLSGRISVAASVDPAQGGAIWRLRDGTGAVAPGPVGESGQINRWRDALAAPRMTTPGGPTLSATGQAANAASAIASLRVNSDELLSFAAARRDTLYAAETAGGVDTDQELQMLLRIEQAYAANAKVIQTIGSMMQTLMEI
jgi:flagellar hook-associated protein 1 FlgK